LSVGVPIDWGEVSANWTEFGKGVFSAAHTGADTFNRWSLDVVTTLDHGGWGTLDAILNFRSQLPPGTSVLDFRNVNYGAGPKINFILGVGSFFRGYVSYQHEQYHPGHGHGFNDN
jgi:hypothetical protein